MNKLKEFLSELKDKASILIGILAVLSVVGCYVLYNSRELAFPDRYYGIPVISTEYPSIDISIDQVLDDGRYLYVLYHHSNGIIQVYDMDGSYQHTLFFYCHTKGGFSMVAAGRAIYVQDMRENVYVFEEGKFISFLEKEAAERELSHIDFRTCTSSPNYEIRENSIWRTINGSQVCIVGEPKRNVAVSVWSISTACVIFTAFISHLRQSKQ